MGGMNSTKINKGTVLSFMCKALALRFQADYSLLVSSTLGLMAEAGLIEKETDYGRQHHSIAKEPLGVLLVESYQYLLTQGVIIPNTSPPNYPNPNFYRLTDYGREWIKTPEPIPEDLHGFLNHLKELIPNINPVIEQYTAESLKTFERGAFFASAVMIGAASEKAIYMLIEALGDAVQNTQIKQRIDRAMDRRRLPTLFKLISDILDPQKTSGRIPYKVHEGSDIHLLSLAEAIRVQRNDAVHPTIGVVTPLKVRLSIASFPGACRKVYDLIEWLKNNRL